MTNWATVGATWNVPTFVGEFGGHNTDADLPFTTAHFDDGTEHTIANAVVRPFARAVAGDSVTTSFDATTRQFTLARSHPAELLVQSDPGVAQVELRVTPK